MRTLLTCTVLLLLASLPLAARAQCAGGPGPYGGTPWAVPGTIEAEHFNCGGENVGYHDTTAASNPGQTFRASEGVEVVAAPGGLAVNVFDTGEWMSYTINVPTAGMYTLGILASASASGGGPGAYRMQIDGLDVTGLVAVPLTSGWEDYVWVDKTGVSLTAGQHVLKLMSEDTYYRIDKLRVVAEAACNTGTLRPYNGAPVNGTPIAIPAAGATFEAEHFDCGGQAVAYNDNAAVNSGQTFRADEGIELVAAPSSGLAINQFEVADWMIYTINVAQAGTYNIGLLTSASASGGGPGEFRIEIDGTPVAGNVAVPLTAGWEDYRWVSKNGVTLSAGQHRLKVVSTDTYFRIDKLRIMPGGSGDCSTSGLTMCLTWEPATTTYSGTSATSTSLGSFTWFGQNAAADQTACASNGGRLCPVSTSRDGTTGLKFTTLSNDINVHGSGSGNERSELQLGPGGNPAATGQGIEQWWAHSVYMPADFAMGPNAYDWALFLQFHDGAGGQPLVAMEFFRQRIVPSSSKIVFRVRDSGAGGLDGYGHQYRYWLTNPSYGPITGQCIHDGPVTGVWYDFVHQIRWSATGTGIHRVWMREGSNATGKLVLNRTGISNMHSTSAQPYLKFGHYHVAVPGNSAVIHDRIRRGDSFAAVANFPLPTGGIELCPNTSLTQP